MKKLLFVLLFIFFAVIVGYQVVKSRFAPEYHGTKELSGLQANSEVYFDDFGIPHIYAENELDAYMTLGFVHAQDRLFQMEMMRRVGSGTLAELLGEDLVDVDKFFRTLGIPKHAEWSTEEWNKEGNTPWKAATDAYIKGVNQFIENGKLPLEYTLLGTKPREFTINDVHSIVGYMSFTFAMAMKTDPLITKISRQLGPDYMKVLSVHTLPEHHVIPNNYPNRNTENKEIIFEETLTSLLEKLPVPLLEGSNSWVIDGSRTASGDVLFLNDTHIGFAQPSVWYEAHLEYPEFSFYGNHLAGVPFGLVGHTRELSIGLTMFENDDQDFFEEQLDPNNPNQTVYGDAFKPLITRLESISIKDKDPIEFEVKESVHGPIMNEVIPEIGRLTNNPVASWWVYILEPTRALEAVYRMNHAQNIQEVESAVRLIHAPGLNVMYGDKAGNIAWWAAAKLPIRPEHVNSKVFLDGTSHVDEPTGWMPFEENPMSINPESGFVASANNQPDTLSNGTFFPGYYYPGDRWNRIAKTVSSRNDWTQESIKSLQLETLNENHPITAKSMIEAVENASFGDFESAKNALTNWDGNHDLESIAPTVYYKWLYHTLHGMMVDELGDADFESFLKTFLYIRSVPTLIQTEDSPWWDDSSTEKVESRSEIIKYALEKTLSELNDQFGSNTEKWAWKNAVVLEHPHPLGAKKPLDKIFNVKAPAVSANEESVNKLAFDLNGTGIYQVKSGPAMRIIIDFANVEASESILPTGQSGNLFSPYYSDQAEMFATGKYRPQLMNESQIKNNAKGTITFTPKSD
ncbi:penicillin acylase family protein [Belliella aquatica]|uniref:Penicillin amidase n=1 Tax=Belliella aquatica TaxID=1323734 RepID=A0ABQ1LVA5_9BACT|nr:penicillin acylase family protein [Belliella aquatica]MCH7405850.1 penicillin acylase family protein [Belliella aquatica]GGC30239.1 penicillin amidase [Belliella aquatica]